MRILILAWRDLANELAGGSEVLIDKLAAGMTARGHDVTLMCANPIGEPRAYPIKPNGGTVDQFLRAPFEYLRNFRDVDLVVDVANGVSFYTPFFRRKPSICFVNHLHTDQWVQWFPRPLAAIGRNLELRAMPAVYRNRLFVAVSPSTAEVLHGMGVDRERIRIIINGTTVPEHPSPESPEPLFLGMGRLVPHKRFDLAVQAFEAIRPQIGGRLVIAGKGPELEPLRAMAGPGVEIRGHIDDDEKERLLASAWLLVHPASHEGWGLVVTEAAAHGTPALAFRVPGLKDSIVDGLSGVLVDRPEDLASTWLRLASDPAWRARLRSGARLRAEACTWERTVERFEEICEEAVSSHHRSLRVSPGRWLGHHIDAPGPAVRDLDAPPTEFDGLPVGTGRPSLRVVRDQPELTIVVPSFDEAARLPLSLPVLLDHVAQRSGRTEILVVDDGSSDGTAQVATRLLAGVADAHVLRLDRHAGKGAAVRAGVGRATGEQIVFTDADLAADLSQLDPLLAALDHVHVAVGSRTAPGAAVAGVTPSSDASYRAFNQLARAATGLGHGDFLCGFKAFRGPAGKLLFHLAQERGFAFDVEILALADRIGYSVQEVPVRWQAVRGSHARIVADSAAMALHLTRIARRARRGQPLSSIEVHDRSHRLGPDRTAALVRAHLPLAAPVLAWDDGALALLPFVRPMDGADLARDLARALDDLDVRCTQLDERALFDPSAARLRSALVAS